MYFYEGTFAALSREGVHVSGVSSPGPTHAFLASTGVSTKSIPIARTPSVRKDVIALARITAYLVRRRFDLIVVSTPKAALLTALAATLLGRRSRTVYIVRGRAYEDMRGIRRILFAALDRLSCLLSGNVVSISRGLTQSLVQDHICRPGRIREFANGSSKGVNLTKFDPGLRQGRATWRRANGIPENALVVGYVGWLRREKGTGELIRAVAQLNSSGTPVHLLLVGAFEYERDPLSDAEMAIVKTAPYVSVVPWMNDPAAAYAATDIFAFPSYREGFGNVALEAAAMGLPVVASDVPGLRDAVAFGETAVPVPARDVPALAEAIAHLAVSPQVREELGRKGRQRVVENFDESEVVRRLVSLLHELSTANRPTKRHPGLRTNSSVERPERA